MTGSYSSPIVVHIDNDIRFIMSEENAKKLAKVYDKLPDDESKQAPSLFNELHLKFPDLNYTKEEILLLTDYLLGKDIQKQITKNNVVKIISFANRHLLPELADSCLKSILKIKQKNAQPTVNLPINKTPVAKPNPNNKPLPNHLKAFNNLDAYFKDNPSFNWGDKIRFTVLINDLKKAYGPSDAMDVTYLDDKLNKKENLKMSFALGNCYDFLLDNPNVLTEQEHKIILSNLILLDLRFMKKNTSLIPKNHLVLILDFLRINSPENFFKFMDETSEEELIETLDYLKNSSPEIFKDFIEHKDEKGQSLLLRTAATDSSKLLAYLIKNGADINSVGKNKYSALSIAIIMSQKENFDLLLKKEVDVEIKDFRGNTVLHHACKNEDPYFTKELLNHTNAKKLLHQKNHYNLSPYEIALRKKYDSSLLVMFENEDFKLHPLYGKWIDISQGAVIGKLKSYLSSDLLNNLGNCNGFSFLGPYYKAMDREEEYYETLEFITTAKESIDDKDNEIRLQQLNEKYQIKNKYKNFNDLIHQWANDIIYFQYTDEEDMIFPHIDKNYDGGQFNRKDQFQFVKPDFLSIEPVFPYFNTSLTRDQIFEYFNMMSTRPGTVVDIGIYAHSISVYVNKNSSFSYYESNFPNRIPPISSTNDLLDIILNLGLNTTESIYDIELSAYRYEFSKKEDLSTFEVDPGVESPLKFSPLHKAIFNQNTEEVERILSLKAVHPLEKDAFNLSPLVYAAYLDNFEVFKMLCEDPRTNLKDDPTLLIEIIKLDKPQFLDYLLEQKNLNYKNVFSFLSDTKLYDVAQRVLEKKYG